MNLENQNVTNNILRQDLIKYLEKYLFGEDIESSPPKEDYPAETDECLKYMEEQEKDQWM